MNSQLLNNLLLSQHMNGGARKAKAPAKKRVAVPPPVMVRAPIPVRIPYNVALTGTTTKPARRVSKAQEKNKELRKTVSDQKKLLKAFQKYVKDVKKPVKMTPCFV